jgi:hypothetical protein
MRNRVTIMLTVFVLLVGSLLAGCSNKATDEPSAQLSIEWDQSLLPVAIWEMDYSHLITVTGKVLADGKPVAGVGLTMKGKHNMTTDEYGVFTLQVDTSYPQSLQLQINSAEQATLEGKSLGDSSKEALLSSTSQILVYYPIQISEVTADPIDSSKVEVHARAVSEDGHSYPLINLDKYIIQGTVKDSTGNPVQGAIVSYSRESGDSWSFSQPSDDNGEYMLNYFPHPDSDLDLRVNVGEVQYTLPANRVIQFPVESSMNTDIILPATGTIIEDKPPTLVSKATDGAYYWSQAIGLVVDPSVTYSVSLPAKDGSFVIKIDKAVWDTSPSFFQTGLSKFSKTPLVAGDFIPSEWIPAPNEGEPTGIVAEAL